MANNTTIRERLSVIETKLTYLNQWLKAIIVIVLASMGVDIII